MKFSLANLSNAGPSPSYGNIVYKLYLILKFRELSQQIFCLLQLLTEEVKIYSLFDLQKRPLVDWHNGSEPRTNDVGPRSTLRFADMKIKTVNIAT